MWRCYERSGKVNITRCRIKSPESYGCWDIYRFHLPSSRKRLIKEQCFGIVFAQRFNFGLISNVFVTFPKFMLLGLQYTFSFYSQFSWKPLCFLSKYPTASLIHYVAVSEYIGHSQFLEDWVTWKKAQMAVKDTVLIIEC